MCEHRAESCAYTYSIRHRVTVAEGEETKDTGPAEMLESLRTLPDEHALELLRQLRNESASPLTPSPRPYEHHQQQQRRSSPTIGLLPPSQKSLEFELNLRHPVAYPTLSPITSTDVLLEALLEPRVVPDMTPDREERDVDIKTETTTPRDHLTSNTLFDERLRLVDIAQWTPVPIPNRLAINTISHYLEVEYAALPLFDANLFIQDLVDVQYSFCSPFLVTAILCSACQAYTPLHSDAEAFSVALFNQAQQHFSDQEQSNTLTTVAALQILSMCAATFGKDDMSLRFLQESARLGRLMGLFDVQSQAESATAWLGGHEEWTRTASYTAWGVFNWICVYSFQYHIFEIETPPLLPKPCEFFRLAPGEDSNPARTSFQAQTALHARVLSSSSDMWIISRDILQKFYSDASVKLRDQTSVVFAEGVYQRLLDWANRLPLELARGRESSDNVMMMHVYFHAVITDLFRPFLLSPIRDQRLRSFSSEFATLEAVYAASSSQLKRLLLLCRLRWKTCLSALWQTVLVYAANSAIREAKTSVSGLTAEGSLYLHLCLAWLKEMFVCFPVFGSLAKGLTAMALQTGAIDQEDATRVLEYLRQVREHRAVAGGMNEKPDSRCILDFELSMTNPDAAQGRNVAMQLQSLVSEETKTERPG
ncbi:Nitrogen assimilation transcription factor nit-4-like protein 13 [Colletotrichum chlorophyti]|uniref:Nitrogen assimilation transcription factor nit-4-like protein 13 n=1 Tax=Colletotrichum chlorophyti TaxID=708187 RepID=A0A1Q8R9G2_9PEZI|nr:Nitrogen assimilation transcription factor nit-4-like protein 13 [Colletotrichum chlorophyti]